MTRRLDALPPEPREEPDDPSQAGNDIVRKALDYMQAHAAEPHPSLNDVAEHVYVSQWHLPKLLNRETKQSFFNLLGGIRVGQLGSLQRRFSPCRWDQQRQG